MTRFTDGEKTVEITMSKFDGTNLSPDMSADLLQDLLREKTGEAYKIDNVDDLIDYVNDWAGYREECYDREALEEERENDKENGLERIVDVVVL